MKNNFLISITFLTISLQCLAQTKPKNMNQAKWQQRVNYTIEVELNTDNQTLSAFESLVYANNSPNALTEIYFHLWPNAYKNRTTAYAKQELENGNTNFHFAEPSEGGFIDSLDFKVNGQPIKWELTEQIDIAKLTLNQPLAAGDSIIISTPFFVKIPKVFSRMGYENGHYCITQWYPKPAVYDINGWNPMPYLNQGEFYSEFGSFDVQITLPKNILVAATGEVQDKREKEWWRARKQEINTPHYAPTTTKTLRFKQDNIHDFAWFANKDYRVDFDTVTLNNGQKVETWIFEVSKKEAPKGIEHLNDGVKYYSDKVGNYPYSIAQVVITPLIAGGGMEYPTITNCGSIDRTTIIHEVGHNWFYGILGSNERDYPWMDESINTYYEERSQHDLSPNSKAGAISLLGMKISQLDLMVNLTLRKNLDQAGNLKSDAYTDANYGAIVYGKNPKSFAYLQNYLGDDVFDRMMQAYYIQWKFKHPLPNDFRNHVETFTGKKLSWFFDELMGTTKKMDYSVKSLQNSKLTLKNKGQISGPILLNKLDHDTLVASVWLAGFANNHTFSLDSLGLGGLNKFASFEINPASKTLDLYPQNNFANANGIFKTCVPIKFQALFGIEKENAHQIFVAPVYGYNLYNKNMFGLSFYNSLFPQKKTEIIFTPLYSFDTKDLNGFFSIHRNIYQSGKIRNIQIGLKAARFGNNAISFRSNDIEIDNIIKEFGSYTDRTSYEKIAPFIKLNLRPKDERSNIDQTLTLRYVMVNEQFTTQGYYANFGSDQYGVSNLNYHYQRGHALYPSSFNFDYQYGIKNNGLNRLALDFTQSFTYSKYKKAASIRLFTGMFFTRETYAGGIRSVNQKVYENAMFTAGGTSGTNDYLFDEVMIGRSDFTPGFWSHQVLQRDAGFRNFVNLGSTDRWISAANLTVPFPLPVPLGFYGDFSYAKLPFLAGNNGNYSYVGGLYIQIIKDILCIYVPAVSSENVSEYWDLNKADNIFKKTSFTLNLSKLSPIQFIRNFKL
jgi:hypothetical protein